MLQISFISVIETFYIITEIFSFTQNVRKIQPHWVCGSANPEKKKNVKYPVCRQSTLISSIFYVCLFPTEFYFKTYNETLSTQYMVLKRNWPFICVHEWVLIRFDQSWQSDLFCRWLTQKIQLYPSIDTIRLVLWSLCLSTPKFKS